MTIRDAINNSMKNQSYSILIVMLMLVISCQKKETAVMSDVDTTFHLDWHAMSTSLMQRMNIGSGEKVLLVASPGRFDEMIPLLKEKILAAKGEYLGTISIDT